MNVEASVRERYSKAIREPEPALCCPVEYDQSLLGLLPQEILERDYGCGDPTPFVRPGDTVLDLGSGAGKHCYMAAQRVGEEGRVIGIDMNDDMLALSRKYQPEMAEKLGGDRVRFVKGYIYDLALDVEAMGQYLAEHPVRNAQDLAALQAWQAESRAHRPLIADNSVDVVISNCVLNLVEDSHKPQLAREIHRVLRPGGRVAVSDIVSDEPVPPHLKNDPILWSGCLSGAFLEQEFPRAFVEAGFVAVKIDKWAAEPWQVIEGIEFRSVTLTAVKGEGKECLDYGHAVIYRGPFADVRDEEGHIFPRGERIAVCARTYRMLTEGPYKDDFIGIPPAALGEPKAWCAPPGTTRPPAVTKGASHASGCSGSGCC
jgi:ubiquinone/menaquinone biosynthesis C-methylase UbiE